jgi:pilus assembly protein CpaB
MQRGRFLILIGVLLAVMAVALFLVMSGGDGEEEAGEIKGDEGEEVVVLPTPTPTPVPNPVVVAKQRIPRGTLLITGTIGLNEWISVENWPQGWVSQDALASFDQVVGKIARSDIPRGTLLTADMLTEQAGDLVSTGSDASLLIPPNRVALAIPVDHISSVGWALRRGDHVDILVSFLMIELDSEFQSPLPNEASPVGIIPEGQVPVQGALGRFEQDPFGQPINVVPSEDQRPRLVSQITVQDAEVLNVGPWLPWGELFRAAVALGVPPETIAPEEEEAQQPDEAPPVESDEPVEDDVGGAQGVEAEPEIITSESQALVELLASFSRQPVEPLLLIVSPQDALVLKWSIERGAAIHVVLRSYSDVGQRFRTEAVTLQYMVDQFNIGLPPGLEYGVDPVVRELERSFLELPDDPLDFSQQTPGTTSGSGSSAPPR